MEETDQAKVWSRSWGVVFKGAKGEFWGGSLEGH